MKITIRATAALLSGVLMTGIAFRPAHAETEPKLWANLHINSAVFTQGQTKKLMLEFTIINDGTTTVDTRKNESHLFINGKEWKDWQFTVGNGPSGGADKALVPNGTVGFTYAMGEQFQNPGIYRVRWEGAHFKAPEITFRVLPSKGR